MIDFGLIQRNIPVNHIEVDDQNNSSDQILFSRGSAIFSYRIGAKKENIFVGNLTIQDYVDDTGDKSRFNLVTGFTQRDGYIYACDYGNKLIRRIDKSTKVVETLFGHLQASLPTLPKDRKFDMESPRAIIKDPIKKNRMYVIHGMKITPIIIEGPLTSGESIGIQGEMPASALAYIAGVNRFYIAQPTMLKSFSLKVDEFVKVLPNDNVGALDDGVFKSARIGNVTSIISLDFNSTILLVDEAANRIRVMDDKKKIMTSICTGTRETLRNHYGAIDQCSFKRVTTVTLLKKDVLLVGTRESIAKIKREHHVFYNFSLI